MPNSLPSQSFDDHDERFPSPSTQSTRIGGSPRAPPFSTLTGVSLMSSAGWAAIVSALMLLAGTQEGPSALPGGSPARGAHGSGSKAGNRQWRRTESAPVKADWRCHDQHHVHRRAQPSVLDIAIEANPAREACERPPEPDLT